MTAFELYFCVTVLRGALAVLFLLAAGSLLRDRLPPGLRRLLWLTCLVLMLIPQMNFSASPFRLDLSELRQGYSAAGAVICAGESVNDPGKTDVASCLQDRSAAVRALWRHLALHRKALEFSAIMLLPLPALFLLFARYWRCRRTIRPLPPVTDRRVLDAWNRVLAECGPLPRPVILLDSSGPGLGPTLFGCFNCKLLLPVEAFQGLSDGELGLLLEHEYHHGKAGDPVVNIAALVLWALAWYNPFMLIARRKLRASCEMECDRKILARHPHAVCQYGNLLLRFVSPPTPAPSPAVGLTESPRELSRRIQSMTAGVSHPGRCGRWAAILIALVLAAPVALVAVNAKPAAPHPVAAKPVLPHLVLKPLPLSGGKPGLVQCWALFYPAAFPAGQSSLALEIGKARLGAELALRPSFLLLWREEAPAVAYRLESVSALPFALCETSLSNEPLVARVVPSADRKAVDAALVGTAETAAITLEVHGLGPSELKDYSAVPLYR